MKIVRDAKSGKFVPKSRAKDSPGTTITQKPIRMTSKTLDLIHKKAMGYTDFPITPSVVAAVLRAYKSVTRQK